MQKLQLVRLHKTYDVLQKAYGAPRLAPIYGAGCISRPQVMCIFINPTGRNVSAVMNWRGIRAPWLGTKNIWRLLRFVNLLEEEIFQDTQRLTASEWTPKFAKHLYEEIAGRSVFITNLAKCTQRDARHLRDRVFLRYRPLILREITLLKPAKIVTFGNQVSSVILRKSIRVSDYAEGRSEALNIGREVYPVYPVYYPVGQGMRNMPLAVSRLKKVISGSDDN